MRGREGGVKEEEEESEVKRRRKRRGSEGGREGDGERWRNGRRRDGEL